MIDEPEAREVAKAALESSGGVFGPGRELNDGWFFPYVSRAESGITASMTEGVIVNKVTGRPLVVMTPFPMACDLTLYDRGYHFEEYDLVVLAVTNFDETVRVLHSLHFVTVDTYYKYDRVYRVGRGLTEDEIRERLSRLPCVLSGRLDYRIDELEHAREAGWFVFKTFEYRGKK